MGASRVERGTTLQGEYELLECVGEHSGLVFRALRRRDGAAVMVRVFAGFGTEVNGRLLEFATRASRVRHPALASVSACAANGDDVFVVEEQVAGRSLAELCERAGIPALSRSVDIALQLARALESAHRSGVAHDALCPRNVLLRSATPDNAPQLQVKLVDLGVPAFARAWPPALSSALYMAPEQLAKLRIARSQDGATPSMNVFSLGALLYDLCTGGPPFAASSVDELGEAHAVEPVMPPSRINPQIPSTLDTALLRALSKNPAQRFASMGELIEALSGVRLSTGVSGVQPVLVNTDPAALRASSPPEGATFHGKFDERPTSKTELPPPIAKTSRPPRTSSRRPAPSHDEITSRGSPPAARAEDETKRQTHPRRSSPPLGSFSSATPQPMRASVPPPPPLPRATNAEPLVRSAASIELLRSSQAPHLRLQEQLRAALSQLLLWLRGRERFLPIALLFLCLTSALLFWRASRVPLPEEHVRTTSLAPTPYPDSGAQPGAGSDGERTLDPRDAIARVQESLETGSDRSAVEPDSARSERAERAARGQRANGRELARAARPNETHPARVQHADASAPSSTSATSAREISESSRLEADPAPPPDALEAEVERAPSANAERVPVKALEPTASEGQAAATRSAPAGSGAVEPAAQSQRPKPSAAGRFTGAHVAGLTVRGSLPSSIVMQGIERVVPQLNGCYRAALASAGKPPPASVQVAFELDEHGRARSPRVRGAASPALQSCVSAAAGRIASRSAPDTGTVAASFQLVFVP